MHTNIFALPISIPEAKLVYLKKEKSEILNRIGIIDYSTEDLSKLINEKIEKSYLYNLEYLEEYSVPKFNVLLILDSIAGHKRKVLVSLKYIVESKQLQLITMY